MTVTIAGDESGPALRPVLILLTVLLALLALACAALFLGALASLSASGSPQLAALAAGETLLSGRLFPRLGLAPDAFWRGLLWALSACVCTWLSAYLKPR